MPHGRAEHLVCRLLAAYGAFLGNLSFDAFLHDWMVVTLKKPVPKGRAMYTEFKRFAADSSLSRMERAHGLLENMLEYAGYYAVIKGVAAAGSGDMSVDRRLESIQNLDTARLRIHWLCTCSQHGRAIAQTATDCCACSRIWNRICSAEWSARYPATD